MQEKYRVLALDQRGHDDSEWATDYAPERMVEDTGAFVRALDLKQFVLLGLSTGGRSAMIYVPRTRKRSSASSSSISAHPGTVSTGMWSMNEPARGIAPGMRASIGMLTPEESAEVLEWHATSVEAAQHSGAYFELTELQEVETFARDDEAAERLWEVSEG